MMSLGVSNWLRVVEHVAGTSTCEHHVLRREIYSWSYALSRCVKSAWMDMPGWSLLRNLDDELHQKWNT